MPNPYAIAIKYGLIALAIISLCVGLVLYGMHRKQLEWDASLTQQAIKSSEQMVAQAENTAQVEVRYIKEQGATEIRTKIIEKEVVRYVESPAKQCVFDAGFERTFDRISGMLDDPAVGVPAAEPPTGDAPLAAASGITDAEVLFAYHDAVRQLSELWNRYEALVEWVRTSHELAHEAL